MTVPAALLKSIQSSTTGLTLAELPAQHLRSGTPHRPALAKPMEQ